MERKNNLQEALLSLFLFFIGIILILVFYNNLMVLEKQVIYSSFIASDTPGFDVNLTALTFGQVPVGQGASRGLFITNDFEKGINVVIKSSGDISDFLIVSENSFYLSPGEKKEIDFNVLLPKDLEFKKYGGEIEIISKRY